MNKFLTKIIGASLAIAMMIGVGVGVNAAKEAKEVNATSPATLTFGAACGGSGTDSDGNTWTVTSDAAESAYDNTKGIHYGTGSKAVSYLNLSTSGISSTITQIVVNASGASKTSAKLDVTIGGAAFGTQKSLTASAANYTFAGSASGEIVVALTQSSATKALYCKSIEVTYSGGGEQPPVETCTVTFNYQNGSNPTNVTVNKNGTIANQMPADPTKDTDTENQIKYSFGGWFRSDDPNNISYTNENKVTQSTVITSDMNLYAKWTAINYYFITFEANGGTAVESVEVDEGKKIATPVSTKTGYILEGWYTTENFAPETKVDFYSDTFASNTTLYAKWVEIAIQEKGVFVKVSSIDDLVDEAKYLITYDNSKVFNGYLTTIDASSNFVAGTMIENKYIKKDDNTAKAYFTIVTKEGHKYIKSAQGMYIGKSANSNGLDTSSTQNDNFQNTISFDESGNVVITGKGGAVLRYNSASGQYRFRYYKTGSYDSMQPIQLYKFVEFDELFASVSTQSMLSYHYVKEDANYSYSNISMRFGGSIDKALWNELDTDEHLIAGVGVMITGYEEQQRSPYSIKDHAAEAVPSTEEHNINTQVVDYYVALSSLQAMPEKNNEYYWNLKYSIDSIDDMLDAYTAAAYIKLTNGELVFLKQVKYSVWSLAKDYLDNRNCNEETAGGSLYNLVNNMGLE